MSSKTELVRCPSCGKRFPNNPEKHKYRQKLTPCCRVPYTSGSMWVASIDFKTPKRILQKLFSFFPKISKKEIYWKCPKCGFLTYSKQELRIRKIPDKTETIVIDGKPQVVPVTYRYIPSCLKCGTYMEKHRRKEK